MNRRGFLGWLLGGTAGLLFGKGVKAALPPHSTNVITNHVPEIQLPPTCLREHLFHTQSLSRTCLLNEEYKTVEKIELRGSFCMRKDNWAGLSRLRHCLLRSQQGNDVCLKPTYCEMTCAVAMNEWQFYDLCWHAEIVEV